MIETFEPEVWIDTTETPKNESRCDSSLPFQVWFSATQLPLSASAKDAGDTGGMIQYYEDTLYVTDNLVPSFRP